jgi:hypothetical protein
VRDVARGEVFIHRRWTNDPWLLIGQALRRTPWFFDPRYLRRPFYYRTEANRLVTRFVLCHARHAWPYALFQFGHEIKAARHDAFYRVLRRVGANVEAKVCADGTFRFEPLMGWLEAHARRAVVLQPPPLWSDDEVIADIVRQGKAGERLTAFDVAARYTYPLKYVEEVLLPKINRAQIEASGQDGQAAGSLTWRIVKFESA